MSTSRQEFFGISLTEAVYAGAFPIVPAGLVYPERIPKRFHERCLYEDDAGLVDRLQWAIAHRDQAGRVARDMNGEMAHFDWSVIAPRLDERLEQLTTG